MSDQALAYQPLDGDLHRHGEHLTHVHPHSGPHTHEPGERRHEPHDHQGEHGHSHGLVDESVKRSRAGLRALLADLIHNFGDAATAIPLGIAFLLRSERAERYAGLFVVAAIFISACVAGAEAVSRLIHPQTPTHLPALAGAGVIGYAGNWVAAQIRTRAGRALDSPALIADGNHARADAYVSLAVIGSAAVVALGLPIADPLIGLGITLVILKITWDSWRTVRGHYAH